MANHIRQQIRERVGTTLTGLTTTSSNVFQSRVYPLENSNLPAIIIYTKSEDSEPVVIGTNRLMNRELTLAVEAYVKSVSNSDDTIDTITKEVESALAADITLNGLAKDTYLESTEITYTGEGEKPIAVCTMNFIIEYCTAQLNPDVAA